MEDEKNGNAEKNTDDDICQPKNMAWGRFECSKCGHKWASAELDWPDTKASKFYFLLLEEE